jgi:ribonuclease R
MPAAQRPRGGTDAAASRPFGQSVERSFYCRSCRLTARGRWVPVGWYVLERAAGGGARHLRVGLYCSLDCLAAAGDDLAAAEQDAGVRRGLPADAARDRARLLETAQTLLHQGATIRAAGDELGLPTSTLRHWLREAGVRVGADGTLTGSVSSPPLPATDEDVAHNDRDGGGHRDALGPAVPPPAGEPAAPVPADAAAAAGGRGPVQALNELAQAGYVTDLAWENAAEGEAHRPVFTCAVTARVTGIGGPVSARGTGGSKAAAKASAAAALLVALAGEYPDARGAPVTGAGLRPGPRSESQKLRDYG